jgi:TonB-dependent receptor
MMEFLFKKADLFKVGLLSVFLLMGSVLLAQNPNQKISLNVQNISVKELIKQIESKTSYTVVYRDVLIDDKKDITINEENVPLNDVLKSGLSQKGLQVTFNNNTIVITKKNVESPIINKTKKVSGIVLDENGQPVIGASVRIPGTNIGVATDINGHFTLDAPSNAKLRISYIGYEAKEELLKASSDMKISLEQTPKVLTEMVVTAQAIGQKNAIRQQINSNTIKNVVAADRLQENPDANATEAIGRLPGVSVQRSGGEGTGLVIRGLEPKYTSVTLNGVLMPSSAGSTRETNISGISQYVLQGVEVYKSLTADMEANSVAGTVNLKLRETDKGFRSNVMAQLGYNNMNNYYGNYKFQGEVSNRFLNNKLGVFFSANAEKVNRSTQTQSSSYSLYSKDIKDGFLIDGVGLNYILKTKYRQSAMLSFDYKLSPTTTLNLYGLYSYNRDDSQSESKSFTSTEPGKESMSLYSSPNINSNTFQSALSGLTKLDFLKMEIDYGVAFSQILSDNPQSRSWNFSYDKDFNSTKFIQDSRKLINPQDVVAEYDAASPNDSILILSSIGQTKSNFKEINLTSYLNFKMPFKIGEFIAGNVKFGGTYRTKTRRQDVLSGAQGLINNRGQQLLLDELSWLHVGGQQLKGITAEGMQDFQVNNFMDGQYNFGSFYDLNKLNQITDTWSNVSEQYYALGENVYLPVFGQKSQIGFYQDISGSILNDQDIVENYGAGYLMTEVNFGKWVMFLPGVRYEATNATMKGFYAVQPTVPGAIYDAIPGDVTSATRSDQFLLPMMHLRIKPTNWFYTHIAYTQTLNRPDYNAISPNTWVYTGFPPFQFISSRPNIRAEHWTNYDVQMTVYGPKIGLFSVSGFYKTVQDKIWNRSYTRLKGDPIIDPFPDAALVKVSQPENHQYPIYLKGVEVELQTSFWYLPKPFCYFTFSTNYTYTDSQTQNPYSYFKNVIPVGGGRPVATRVDSTTTAVMLFQPKHILNLSLGYNRKGLNVWLSYQYNGLIYTSQDQQLKERDAIKEFYNRWDLQISQKLSGKLKGLEILANIANLSNFTESARMQGDPRPTYMEKYGWTADLGIRYKFQ